MVFQEQTTTGGLYLREGDTTIPISVSQRSGDPDTPRPASFESMTVRRITGVLQGGGPLTDGGRRVCVSVLDLYRYDVASGRLTDLTISH